MKKTLKLVSLLIAFIMVFAVVLAACENDCGVGKHTDENHDGVCDVCGKASRFKHVDVDGDKVCDVCEKAITYTYTSYVTNMPSNWNEMDYSDNADTAILGYIGSSFFSYDYKFENGVKFNADGSINFDGIVEGFTVNYDAATALEDVTDDYATAWDIASWATEAAPVSAGGYAWKITLRQDLTWDDGTPIKAADFVYSMQEQLNQDFMLLRADQYYANSLKIHNAKNYLYQGMGTAFAALSGSVTQEAWEEALETGKINGQTVYIDVVGTWGSVNDEEDFAEVDDVIFGVGGEIWVPINEDTVLLDDETPEEEWMTTKEVAEWFVDYYFGGLNVMLQYNPQYEFFMVVAGEYPDEVKDEELGIFAASEYEIVVVLDSPLSLLKEDGSLSYQAAYVLGSLPLVKQDLYDDCKVEPTLEGDLWTTTYNRTLATTASWGPYKLTSFYQGQEFTLTKNENWYGWALEENAGQYTTDAIKYIVIADEEAARISFWAGQIDDLEIDTDIAADYRNSNYALYAPGSGTFAIQVNSNLDALKASGRNNGVLAIDDFRMALSLGFDRASFAADLFTAEKVCLGLIGPAYLYDVENGLSYRESEAGKKAILRAYGWTETQDGKWTDGIVTYADIDDAIDATTGFNLTLARQYLESAYTELTENAEKYGYDSTKIITIEYCNSDGSTKQQRRYDWTKAWIEGLVAGTSFEGKIELHLSSNQGSKWSDNFKEGITDIINLGGFSGAIFSPFNIIGDHINEGSLSYHTWFNAVDELTLKMPVAFGEFTQGQEVTLTARDWFHSLNGNMTENATYNLSEGQAPVEVRLEILAMLEEYALTHYFSLPALSEYSASLHSAKWHYVLDEYNTFMGFGGLQYMQYDYADDEWVAFVKELGGDLRNLYKTSTLG